MEIEQALHALRAGALRVPECLSSGDAQELASLLQDMSTALATVTQKWGQPSTAQGSAAPQLNDVSGKGATAAKPSPLDVFDSAIISHMMTASTSALRCHDPSRAQLFNTTEPDAGAQAVELAAICERVRKAAPGVVLVLCNANGTISVAAKDACEIKLGYQNVFAASIGLAGPGRLEALRVVVDSFEKAMELDAWEHTSHTVFRRVSSLAMRALAYFQRRANCWHAIGPPQLQAGSSGPFLHGVILEDVLLWLTTYRNLFSRTCCITGKLLAGDSSTQHPTPPVYRNFKCSRRELQEMAADASRIKAYHMHVVPEEDLDWCASASCMLSY